MHARYCLDDEKRNNNSAEKFLSRSESMFPHQNNIAATSSGLFWNIVETLWIIRADGTAHISSSTNTDVGSMLDNHPNRWAPRTVKMPKTGKRTNRPMATATIVAAGTPVEPGPDARFAPSTSMREGTVMSPSARATSPKIRRDPSGLKIASFGSMETRKKGTRWHKNGLGIIMCVILEDLDRSDAINE